VKQETAESSRELTTDERTVLQRVLAGAARELAVPLAAQAKQARVTGGSPTMLQLDISRALPAAVHQDGVLDVKALVESNDGRPEGEILVWIRGGYLSALEYAWVTDTEPTGFPSAERIRIVPSSTGRLPRH
jgi:hypothetical protein